MTEPLVYLGGRMLPASQAHLAIYDAGVVLGATVTEMVRTFRGRPYRLDDHLERLAGSLRYVGFDIGMSMAELADAARRLIEHNAGLLDPQDELGLVVFVTAGEHAPYAGTSPEPPHTTPTVCAHTFPLPFDRWADKMKKGAHLVTPSTRQVPLQCYDTKMKCRSRMHYYLADQQARLVDPDASPLLLDLEGNITETSAANFLMVDRGAIVSPPVKNILPGMSRRIVIELAAQLEIPFVERVLQVYDATNADEAFTTSTPYCAMPVTRLNGQPIADGKPGPIVRRILAAWSEQVGVDIVEQITAARPR